MITSIDDLKGISLYHGTTSALWKPSVNHGYIYLTETISHAKSHATDKTESMTSEGEESTSVIIQIDSTCLSDFTLLPDNDISEDNGYKSWQESLNQIGTLILLGDTTKLRFSVVEDL